MSTLPVKPVSVPKHQRMTLARRDSCRCQEHVQRRKNPIGSLASVSDETSLIQVDGGQGWRLSRLCCLVSQLIASSDRHPRLPIHGHPPAYAYDPPTLYQTHSPAGTRNCQSPSKVVRTPCASCSFVPAAISTQATPMHWQDRPEAHHAVS
jgi:hypothetical protein